MEFIFECSIRYVTHSLRSLMRYRVELERRNSISPSNHVLFCLLYKHLTITRGSRLYSRFKIRTRCHLYMALNKASDVSAAQHSWTIIVIFLSGGNYYSWYWLTWWDGHVGVQNNGKMSFKLHIIIESNSQKTVFAIVLYTNMAAMTSRENRE